MNQYHIQQDLTNEDLQLLQSSKIVAVDTELTGLVPKRDLLCLVQICSPAGKVYFIKTRDWSKAKNLQRLLIDKTVTKVFHFALADCSAILANMNIEVQNPYCTKIASKIARTYSPDHGLNALVREYCGTELDKYYQSSDWLREDLTEKQLQYAANDVIWLLKIKASLEDFLLRKGELSSDISYIDLNRKCQDFIPVLVQLFVNGWTFGNGDRESVFSH